MSEPIRSLVDKIEIDLLTARVRTLEVENAKLKERNVKLKVENESLKNDTPEWVKANPYIYYGVDWVDSDEPDVKIPVRKPYITLCGTRSGGKTEFMKSCLNQRFGICKYVNEVEAKNEALEKKYKELEENFDNLYQMANELIDKNADLRLKLSNIKNICEDK